MIKKEKYFGNRTKSLIESELLDFSKELEIINEIVNLKDLFIGNIVVSKKTNLNFNQLKEKLEQDENKFLGLKKNLLDLKMINNKLFENYVSIKALKNRNIFSYLREFTFLMNLTKMRIIDFEYNNSNNSENSSLKINAYLYEKSKPRILPFNITYKPSERADVSIIFWKSLASLYELNIF
jgi:hypothetical protein